MSTQDRSSEAHEEAPAPSIALADLFDSAQEEAMTKAGRYYAKHLASEIQKEILDNEHCTRPMKKKWEGEKDKYASVNYDSLQGMLELTSAWSDFKKDKAKLEAYMQEQELDAKRTALKEAVDEMTELANKIAALQEEVSEHEAALLKTHEVRWGQYKVKAAKYQGYLEAIRLRDQSPAPPETPSEPEEPPLSPPPEEPKPKRKRRAAKVEDAVTSD